eukprot:CAMPEP_0195510742 /NCGR_PEP_ID=MMETSP0794_2-20130614/3301_1 /TAXON_ID=515487 /ORGANISM="Stephanopyxis turris, Strain CCMP 815" /LENGTH=1368 /DNA_ID=CAMNT_0040638223 /DNA_START=391 /DNA_END=4497 /DNA_ORIENTATION=-
MTASLSPSLLSFQFINQLLLLAVLLVSSSEPYTTTDERTRSSKNNSNIQTNTRSLSSVCDSSSNTLNSYVTDFTSTDIVNHNVLLKADSFSFTQESSGVLVNHLSSPGYTGSQPIYGGFQQDMDGSRTAFWAAGSSVQSSQNEEEAILKLKWFENEGNPGETASALFLFPNQITDCLVQMNSYNDNDLISGHIGRISNTNTIKDGIFQGIQAVSSMQIRFVFHDCSGFHISQPMSMLYYHNKHDGHFSFHAMKLSYNKYYPKINNNKVGEAGTVGEDSMPTFRGITWLGFRLDAVRGKDVQEGVDVGITSFRVNAGKQEINFGTNQDLPLSTPSPTPPPPEETCITDSNAGNLLHVKPNDIANVVKMHAPFEFTPEYATVFPTTQTNDNTRHEISHQPIYGGFAESGSQDAVWATGREASNSGSSDTTEDAAAAAPALRVQWYVNKGQVGDVASALFMFKKPVSCPIRMARGTDLIKGRANIAAAADGSVSYIALHIVVKDNVSYHITRYPHVLYSNDNPTRRRKLLQYIGSGGSQQKQDKLGVKEFIINASQKKYCKFDPTRNDGEDDDGPNQNSLGGTAGTTVCEGLRKTDQPTFVDITWVGFRLDVVRGDNIAKMANVGVLEFSVQVMQDEEKMSGTAWMGSGQFGELSLIELGKNNNQYPRLQLLPPAPVQSSPLDDDSFNWHHVARISPYGGNLFTGNGNLRPNYAYLEDPCYTFPQGSLRSSIDFQRPFDLLSSQNVDDDDNGGAKKILFITGDGQLWAMMDYPTLRRIIKDQGAVSVPNIDMQVGTDGIWSGTSGNVFSSSRNGSGNDDGMGNVWISIQGSLSDGVSSGRIIWGEGDLMENTENPEQTYLALKKNHGGINVYVCKDEGTTASTENGKETNTDGSALDPYRPGFPVDTEVPVDPVNPVLLPPSASNYVLSGTPSPAPMNRVHNYTLDKVLMTFDNCYALRPRSVKPWEDATRNHIKEVFHLKYGHNSGGDESGILEVNNFDVQVTFVGQTPDYRKMRRMTRRRQDIATNQKHELSISCQIDIVFESRKKEHSVAQARYYVSEAFNTLTDRNNYLSNLHNSGDKSFDLIESVSVIINDNSEKGRIPGTPNQETSPPEEPMNKSKVSGKMKTIIGLSTGVFWGVCMLSIAGYFLYKRGVDKGMDSAIKRASMKEVSLPKQKFIAFEPQDDISTLGDPVCAMSASVGTGKGRNDVRSIATMDYDYSNRTLGGNCAIDDDAVSSAGGTRGDSTLPSVGPQTIADCQTVQSGDDDDDDAASQTFSYPIFEEVVELIAPPGKLGIVIDTPGDGAPVLHAVKPSSCLLGMVKVGDKLIAVDGIDVRAMTAMKVSKLISRKSSNPARKFTLVRNQSNKPE